MENIYEVILSWEDKNKTLISPKPLTANLAQEWAKASALALKQELSLPVDVKLAWTVRILNKRSFAIQKLSEVVKDSGINAILYGAAGTGKTRSIQTIPDQEKVLVLSVENGLRTLRESCPNIDVVCIDNFETLKDVRNFLLGNNTYETVVIDSLTDVAQRLLSEGREGKNSDLRAIYGELGTKMLDISKNFRDIPKINKILICQQERVQDHTGRIFYAPGFPGKQFTHNVPYLFDLVCCAKRKSVPIEINPEGFQYAFQFIDFDETYCCKVRGKELSMFEAPDWTIIFNKLNGVKNESNEI